jgi:hypothetical protein
MAVLVEAISVIVRADALLRAFDGDWEKFKRTVPNATLCADGELVRVSFMSPEDAERYVAGLGTHGLKYLDQGKGRDLVVVDQLRGPAAVCEWIEFGHLNLDGDPRKRVAACRLVGSSQTVLMPPDGWTFEGSLSQSFGFVPTGHVEKSLTFIRRENGLDVYRNEMTGKLVYIGRTHRDERS